MAEEMVRMARAERAKAERVVVPDLPWGIWSEKERRFLTISAGIYAGDILAFANDGDAGAVCASILGRKYTYCLLGNIRHPDWVVRQNCPVRAIEGDDYMPSQVDHKKVRVHTLLAQNAHYVRGLLGTEYAFDDE